jgi:hypothetical protein
MQSVPITTDFVSSNLDQGEVYTIMGYFFVSDLRQVGCFLRVALKTINHKPSIKQVHGEALVHAYSLIQFVRMMTWCAIQAL